MTVDSNTGFGSLGHKVIAEYLKDEAPKAPVIVFSVAANNHMKMDGESEEERVNL